MILINRLHHWMAAMGQRLRRWLDEPCGQARVSRNGRREEASSMLPPFPPF